MNEYPPILIRFGKIKLGQFLKLANLVEDGATARIAIQSGDVLVNGEVETRRGKTLEKGAIVELETPQGKIGAQVLYEDESDLRSPPIYTA